MILVSNQFPPSIVATTDVGDHDLQYLVKGHSGHLSHDGACVYHNQQSIFDFTCGLITMLCNEMVPV